MRSLFPGVVCLAALAFLGAGAAAAQAFATQGGRVSFTSSVPLHTFTGTSDRLNGRIDLGEGTVDFYVDLETLETGIGKRDRDMRETLETDKYPFAEFFGRLETPVDLAAGRPQAARVRGTFSIHGVSREIVVDGTITPEGSTLRLAAAWVLRLDDYAIEPPSLLIVKVDPEQKLAIEAVLTRE